nr:Tx-38 [Heteropoda pingtungensis]
MFGMKFAVLIAAAVFINVFSENHDQNCPPEWSLVHQCWKSFEMHYKQFGNDTALNVRQKEVQTMCSCMADAVNQVTTNDIVEITA